MCCIMRKKICLHSLSFMENSMLGITSGSIGLPVTTTFIDVDQWHDAQAELMHWIKFKIFARHQVVSIKGSFALLQKDLCIIIFVLN